VEQNVPERVEALFVAKIFTPIESTIVNAHSVSYDPCDHTKLIGPAHTGMVCVVLEPDTVKVPRKTVSCQMAILAPFHPSP
jgi:hypothetical protein